jgi:hypothetical protein
VLPAISSTDIPGPIVLEIISMAELAMERLGPLCSSIIEEGTSASDVIQDLASRGLFLEPEAV